MMQHVEKASNKPIVTTKGFSIVVFQCSVIVLKENRIASCNCSNAQRKTHHLFYVVLLQIWLATCVPNIIKIGFHFTLLS